MSNTVNGKKCCCCGVKLLNVGYEYAGGTYCYTCYSSKQKEILQREQQKQELVLYIRYLFPGQDIPRSVLQYIDKEVGSGTKTFSGIKKVIYYYYEILGNATNNVSSLIFIIRDYYEETKEYYIKQKEIRKHNDEVDLNIPTKVVKIRSSKLKQSKNNPKYTIHDL